MKMELWIRSQDKRILQKVDNIFLDANYGNKRISTYDGDNIELGTYKTKEHYKYYMKYSDIFYYQT